MPRFGGFNRARDYWTPKAIPSLIAHWSPKGLPNGLTASIPNRINNSIGALIQPTSGDRPSISTLANGIKIINFNGLTTDLKTPDVAALKFAGSKGYWAWHFRSQETVESGLRCIFAEWAEGGTNERLVIQTNISTGQILVQYALSATATAFSSYILTLPQLAQIQAGCWLESIFDGAQPITSGGIARQALYLNNTLLTRDSNSNTIPASLITGDALNYWMASQNSAANKKMDIAHHYIGNNIPTIAQRALLYNFELPQWDSSNLYTTPIFSLYAIPNISAAGSAIPLWPNAMSDDIGILCVETANQPINTPSGWNAIGNGNQGIGTPGSITATRLQIFWKRAVIPESSPVIPSPGDHIIANITTIRGCISSGNPIDVCVGDDSGDIDSASVIIPGATTSVPNCLILSINSRATTSSQFNWIFNGDLLNPVEKFNLASIVGNNGSVAMVTGIKQTAGPYNSISATLGSATRQARITLALKPNP